MNTPAKSSLNQFIRPKQLKQITGLSRTSIWRLEKAGHFPKWRQISQGTVAWLHSEVVEWMESRQEAGKEVRE